MTTAASLDFYQNITTNSSLHNVTTKNLWFSTGRLQIPFYTVILLLAIVGNVLVISTLVQNRRMRTITNLFLLNLAVSDILLGVLCMPFTLIGTLLRDFVFASSVAVSSWTLVAISCERYYAICHPLRSRSWQTLQHAYKIIAVIWIGSLTCMFPIAIFSRLMPTNVGHKKCREEWPDEAVYYERTYNLFLDLILLIIPLVVLCAAYFLITKTLWHGICTETETQEPQIFSTSLARNITTYGKDENVFEKNCGVEFREINLEKEMNSSCGSSVRVYPKKMLVHNQSILRRTNAAKNLQNKQRVIKMLFVLVLEFFICWTPLYVINTIALFSPKSVYKNLGYAAISYFQLLAYSSSCCNPITYCFMNGSFRKAFLDTFKGLRRRKRCSTLRNTQICDVDSLKLELNRS